MTLYAPNQVYYRVLTSNSGVAQISGDAETDHQQKSQEEDVGIHFYFFIKKFPMKILLSRCHDEDASNQIGGFCCEQRRPAERPFALPFCLSSSHNVLTPDVFSLAKLGNIRCTGNYSLQMCTC